MRRGVFLLVTALLVFGLTTADDARGRRPPSQRLEPSDGGFQDRFGTSVSVDGRTAAVGAPSAKPGGVFEGGAVYLFERLPGSGVWQEVGKLTAPDPDNYDHFGVSIALQGGTLVVGADGVDDFGSDSGAVYVYERPGVRRGAWELTATLAPPDGHGQFGCDVDLDGKLLAVGTCETTSEHARAYLYHRRVGPPSTWERARVFRSEGNLFGRTVAVSGDTLLIGASLDSEVDIQAGAVHVYERHEGGLDNWGATVKLMPTAPAPLAQLGTAMDIEDDRMLIGAPGQRGYALVLERQAATGEWLAVARLQAADLDSDAAFGSAVALSGDRALVGSPGNDLGAFSAGAAYLFERDHDGADAWGGVRQFVSTDQDAFEDFGAAVALGRNVALVGDPLDDVSTTQVGSVHFFRAR